MNKEQQIDEFPIEDLVAFLWHNTNMYDEDLIFEVAEALHNAGYRKVAHGYWFDVGSLSCRCSRCGCKNNKESRYCPTCGSKMDAEKGRL